MVIKFVVYSVKNVFGISTVHKLSDKQCIYGMIKS